jgi:hypothetical protein
MGIVNKMFEKQGSEKSFRDPINLYSFAVIKLGKKRKRFY